MNENAITKMANTSGNLPNAIHIIMMKKNVNPLVQYSKQKMEYHIVIVNYLAQNFIGTLRAIIANINKAIHQTHTHLLTLYSLKVA